jgi:proteasome alpha subunit
MQQNQQQAYDRGITIFSPDGRLYQVEYAREAVKRGSASIGVRTDGGVALLADRRIRSSLMEPSSVEKLHKADDHIGIASAGHVADARQLIDFARRQAQVNRLRYEEPVGVEALTKEITDNIQQYTQVGGARPFGVALIVGGVENGDPRLYETDPSGVPTEWKSVAIGNEREAILEHLEEHYRADADLDGAIDLALSALASAKEEALDAEGVLLSTIDADEGYRRRSDEEIASALSELDLDTDEEEGEE